MAAQGGLDLKDIIRLLKLPGGPEFYEDWTEYLEEGEVLCRKDDLKCWLHWQKTELYGMTAQEYLTFAKQDLMEDSDRARINALSNAKRAIECRLDEIFKVYNFKGFSSQHGWKLPYKMQVVQTFGVPAPSALRNLITSKRNILEHEYIRPKDHQEIQNAVDVAELFLEATHRYVEKGYIASAVITHTYLFKPGFFAPTWFGRLLGESRYKNYEYEDGFSDEYKLDFDLEHEAIKLSYSSKELYRRYCREKGEMSERSEPIKKQPPVTIPVCECKEEEVRELMMLLREKGAGINRE